MQTALRQLAQRNSFIPPSLAASSSKQTNRLTTHPARSAEPALPEAKERRPATAPCLMLTLAMLPVSRGVAFAAVQKHLNDFNTLILLIDRQSQGIALPGIRVRMNRQGDVRTDVGSVSSAVASIHDHRMLTLLHDSRQAMQGTVDASMVRQPGDDLEWLDAIRWLQGNAQHLPGSRLVVGRQTTGWSLDAGGMHIVLWADPDGLPRAIEINGSQVFSPAHAGDGGHRSMPRYSAPPPGGLSPDAARRPIGVRTPHARDGWKSSRPWIYRSIAR